MAAARGALAPPSSLAPPPTSLSDGDAHLLLAKARASQPDAVDGWTVATSLSATSFELGNRELKAYARRIAAAAVLRRAWRLVGPIRRATRPVLEVMDEPFRGELEVEATLENVAGKPFPERDDWIVERREDARAAARAHDGRVAVDGGREPRHRRRRRGRAGPEDALRGPVGRRLRERGPRVSRLEERDDPEQIVARLLTEPARGYTNIEAGLRLGGREIRRGRNPRKAGLLITDGVSTAGGDPLPAADAFPRLHVLLTEDYKMDPGPLRAAGRRRPRRGVPRGATTPSCRRKMLDIANRVLR